MAFAKHALGGPSIDANETSYSLELGAPLNLSETVYSSTGTVAFQWYISTVEVPTPTPIAGANAASFNIAAVAASDAGTYSVTVTDSTGPTSAPVAIVAIDPPAAPVILIQPQPTTAVVGQSATFSVLTTGSLPQTFQWFLGTQPIAGATSSTFNINAVRISDAGSYSVTVTNTLGSIPSTAALLTVNAATPPTFSTQPPAVTNVSYGSFLILNTSVAGSTPIFYQWYLNGAAISGANLGTYAVQSATGANSGTYTLKAINAAGSAISANAQVTVLPAIPVTITQQLPSQVTIQATSQDFYLYISADGTLPLTYQWYKNGAPIGGATGSEYYFPVVQMSDAGSYTVAITNVAGTVQSTAENLIVVPPTPPSVSTTYDAGRTIRQTFGTQFNIFGPSVIPGQEPQPTVYCQWFLNGHAIPGATSSEFEINSFGFSDVGEYVLKFATAGGTVTTPPTYVNGEISGYPTDASSWVDVQQLGSVAYFLYSSPAEILRYDMSAQEWLPVVLLPSTPAAPTAMRVAAEGIYVAFGQTAFLYSPDFSSRAALPNTTSPTTVIFLNQTYAYLYGIDSSSQSGVFTALKRADQTLAATTGSLATYETEFQHISVSATAEKAFGWLSSLEPTTLEAFDLAGDGTVSGFTAVAMSAYPSYTSQTFVSADGSTVVSFDGVVYNTGTLTYEGALAEGTLDDLCFLADGKIVALRGNQFSLYDPATLALLGRYNASFAALNIFEQGTTVFAFAPSSGTGGPVSVSMVSESAIAAASLAPAPALSTSAAQAVSTVPEDSLIDKNGLVYLLDRLDQNILVWSPVPRTYLGSIPLAGSPNQFTYSATLHRIYVTYADGRITHIDLSSSQAEQPFATVASGIINVTAVDNQLCVHLQDISDSGDYRALFSSAGQRVATETFGDFGSQAYWDSATQDLYDIDASSLVARPIGAGVFGSNPVTLYPETATYPFRFSPDGSLFAAGNGLILSSTTLASEGTLGGPFADAAWLGTTVFGISPSTAGAAVQLWSGSGYTLSATVPLSGVPERIWPLAGSHVMALTAQGSGPIYTVLGATGSVVSEDSNSGVPSIPPVLASIVSPPENQVVGSNVTLSATALGSGDTYQWQLGGSNIPGANSPTLTLNDIQTNESGSYQLIISDAYGQITIPFYITVSSPSPPIFEVQSPPVSQTALAGSTATFSVGATGETLSYQWYFQGNPISGATGTTLTLPSVQPASDGAYTVTVTNVVGMQSQSYTPPAAILTVVLNGGEAVAGDLNGDGKPDILWQNTSTGDCGIYLMNGTAVTGWADIGTVPTQWKIAGTGDFLGNGNTDIVWQNTSTGECGIYMMNGTTVTGWVDLGTIPTQWRIAGTGDFLGNGNTDIVWQNTSTGECGIYMMNGTTITGWVDLGTIPLQWQIAAVGVFNNAGQPDILWHNTATGDYGFYMMSGTAVTGWAELGTIPSPWRVGAVADYNGDGNTDILWQNSSTGECGFYLMNGTSVTGWAELSTVPTQWKIAP